MMASGQGVCVGAEGGITTLQFVRSPEVWDKYQTYSRCNKDQFDEPESEMKTLNFNKQLRERNILAKVGPTCRVCVMKNSRVYIS